MRHTRRNPQKSLADPVPDPEKIIKGRNISQKGASRSGKPKQSSISLKEKLVIEQIHVENIASSTSSAEKFSEIHKAPYSSGSLLALSLKETSTPIPHIPLVLFVEVNPLCRQRRSLLAQIGSSNNQTMLSRKFLIAN